MLKISLIAFGLVLMFPIQSYAGEKSLYDFLWLDPDKKVYVLQNKLYKKEHTFYADVGYIANFTSKFQETYGIQGKAGFYFHEEWGIELFYNKYSNSDSADIQDVRRTVNLEPFVRRINSSYGALAIWSPFYGKINTFNRIFYFDWSFGAGVGKLDAESNVENPTLDLYRTESYTSGVLKTNVKFHLRENIHLGLEYMNTYYMAPGPKDPKKDTFRTNTDIIVSVGFSF